MGETILILGGGIGGVVAANTLRRLLPREHRVVLVEREKTFVYAPSLVWIVDGARTAAKISRPVDRLGRKGIEVVRGEVEKIDPERREAVVEGRTLAGDHLVVALGAELAPEAVPGLAEAGHNFYTLAGATSLRDAFAAFTGGRLVVLTAAPAYKCPAAPYETALVLEALSRRRGIRARTQIDLYAAEPMPMGAAGPEAGPGLRRMIEERGIAYHPEHQVTAVNSGGGRLRFANGAEASFELLAYVPPHRAPKPVREAGLVVENGWVAVDRHTLATKFPGVYAIGDVTGIPLVTGKLLPKAGVFAHAEAQVVAANIARAVRGAGAPASYGGDGSCFIEAGDGKAGFGAGNFYAEPAPAVKLHPPRWRWHAAKVVLEKEFLWRWF